MSLQRYAGFMLAEDEEFVTCPYDNAHTVTDKRLGVHLVKCRQNHEIACKKKGEKLQIETCKYNWAHHLHSAELEFHERNCPDQYSVIKHIIELKQYDPTSNYGTASQSIVYSSKGTSADHKTLPYSRIHRKILVNPLTLGSEDETSLSEYEASVSTLPSLQTVSSNSGRKKPVGSSPSLTLNSSTSGWQAKLTSISIGHPASSSDY